MTTSEPAPPLPPVGDAPSAFPPVGDVVTWPEDARLDEQRCWHGDGQEHDVECFRW